MLGAAARIAGVVSGSATDWLSAVASAASAVAAVAALLVARRAQQSARRSEDATREGVIAARQGVAVAEGSLAQQIADARQRALEAERSQAMQVTAWSQKRLSDVDDRRIVARNGSDNPVFDVKLWLILEDPPPQDEQSPPETSPSARTAVVGPRDEFMHPIPTTALRVPYRPPVEISFRDAQGLGWWRDAMGRVRRRPDSDQRQPSA
jgi:hypothetical protein